MGRAAKELLLSSQVLMLTIFLKGNLLLKGILLNLDEQSAKNGDVEMN